MREEKSKKAAAVAAKVENASGDPLQDSITPAKQAADPALPPGAYAKQPESGGDRKLLSAFCDSQACLRARPLLFSFGTPATLEAVAVKRKLDVMEGPSRGSDTPANPATADRMEEAETAGEWGRLEFGNGTLVSLNFPVGTPFVIGRHTRVEFVDNTCDIEAVVDSFNISGKEVISSLGFGYEPINYKTQGSRISRKHCEIRREEGGAVMQVRVVVNVHK